MRFMTNSLLPPCLRPLGLWRVIKDMRLEKKGTRKNERVPVSSQFEVDRISRPTVQQNQRRLADRRRRPY